MIPQEDLSLAVGGDRPNTRRPGVADAGAQTAEAYASFARAIGPTAPFTARR